jgi:hypothetical protein
MTFQEIKEKMQEIGVSDFCNEDYDKTLLPKNKLVSSTGGHEGGGDYAERVFHFIEDNIYVEMTGYYSSYDGTDWDRHVEEVFPEEETIIVYKTKSK